MKKILFPLFSFLLFAPSTLAATIATDYSIDFDQYETKEIAPLTITSTVSGDITAVHGIHLLLDPQMKILWQPSGVLFSGTAMSNGKVDPSVKIEYAKDYKSIYIPVKKDFALNETLKMEGLKLKAYDDDFSNRFIGMDLTGDLMAEVSDINGYEVTQEEANDLTAPTPITDLKHVLTPEGGVKLTWNFPPDYDYVSSIVNRTRIKGGQSMLSTVYNGYTGEYTDNDLKDVTSVTYSIISTDKKGNWSDPVELKLDLTTPQQPETPSQPETPGNTPDTPNTPSEEAAQEIKELTKDLGYYQLRYNIACYPNGIAANTLESRCLWTRIDLIYAQELTNKVVVPNLALSEAELYQIQARKALHHLRYKTYCLDATTPADFCPTLKRMVTRIDYFVN